MYSPHYPAVCVPADVLTQPLHLLISQVTRAMLDARIVPMAALEQFCDEVGGDGVDVPAAVRRWVTVV